MKTEHLLFKISRVVFGFSLAAMLVAMVFSILRKTNIAEQAGVVSYIFLAIGVCITFVDEIRGQKSEVSRNISSGTRKVNSRSRAV